MEAWKLKCAEACGGKISLEGKGIKER